MMFVCCPIGLLLDSFPGIWAPDRLSLSPLSPGALHHQLTAIISSSAWEGEGGTLQAVGNDVFQASYIPSGG